MVPIDNGALVPQTTDLIVMAASGQYGDVDLLLCAHKSAPDIAIAQYAAQYIKYGNLVYQFETPEALGEAIVALDPQSTHDAAQLYREDLARKEAREKGTLEPENPVPAPDATNPTDAQTPPEAPSVSAPDASTTPVTSSPEPSAPYQQPQVLGETLVAPPDPLTPDATSTPTDPGTMSSTTPAIDLSTTTPE